MDALHQNFFDSTYDAVPRWDIARPQKVFVHLEETEMITGSVLDAGCGTGEHALYLASRGHEAVGVDYSEKAIARANAKAKDRGQQVRFVVEDALALEK